MVSARKPELGGGAAGDMELIEYHYPLVVHRYAFSTDSASPGEWRGGCGLVHEVEALDHDMTAVVWGEGREVPSFERRRRADARPRAARRPGRATASRTARLRRSIELRCASQSRRTIRHAKAPAVAPWAAHSTRS